ncbi:hypothetical protein CULT_70010 [[Clostridium] ultunense Esp]|nr:hypothetical protein CULT_70010 [[Clostridium] ultunense Esp]
MTNITNAGIMGGGSIHHDWIIRIRAMEGCERMNRWEERALELAKRWGERAGEYDRTGSFPFQNFEELKKEGFLTLTVPKEYGGEDFSLSQLIRILEILAQGDASTALGLGWHLGIIMKLRDSRLWPEEKFQQLCHEVIESGAMINSIATEPATGSPSGEESQPPRR